MSSKGLAILLAVLFSAWLAFHLVTGKNCGCGAKK